MSNTKISDVMALWILGNEDTLVEPTCTHAVGVVPVRGKHKEVFITHPKP